MSLCVVSVYVSDGGNSKYCDLDIHASVRSSHRPNRTFKLSIKLKLQTTDVLGLEQPTSREVRLSNQVHSASNFGWRCFASPSHCAIGLRCQQSSDIYDRHRPNGRLSKMSSMFERRKCTYKPHLLVEWSRLVRHKTRLGGV